MSQSKPDLPKPSSQELERSAKLVDLIRAQIQLNGKMPFSEFMHTALMHPELGYYRRVASPIASISTSGDFTTAAEFSPLYAATIAHDFAQVLSELKAATILELGPGSGAFAQNCIQTLAKLQQLPERYCLLEPCAARRAEQKAKLKPVAEKYSLTIEWLDKLPQEKITGIVFANEVLDVLPVECFKIDAAQIQMQFVDYAQGKLQAVWGDATENVKDALHKLEQDLGRKLPTGMQSEICLPLPAWLNSLAAVLQSGMLWFADYGYLREVYYHPERMLGTLHCHYKMHVTTDPMLYPGLQDITAHVDFSAVGDVLAENKLDFLGFKTQADYLLCAGITHQLQSYADNAVGYDAYMQAVQQFKRLTDPNRMGEVFKVMAFAKNINICPSGFNA